MNEYFVLVRIESHDFIDQIESYVESAVAEMQGCQHPDDPVRTIETVTTRNMSNTPAAATIGDVCWDLSQKAKNV
jgi:hypothetical protein